MAAGEHYRRVLLIFAVVAIASGVCVAQEVGSIDLTQAMPGKGLRLPARQVGEPRGRTITSEEHECSTPDKNGRALQTNLISLDRTGYRIGDQPELQVQLENVGSAAIRIPFSPNLADLQSADPSQKFSYYKMVVDLWIGGTRWNANAGGRVTLYGDPDHSGTMLTLQPGEWVRIKGKGNIINFPELVLRQITSSDTVRQANARTSIYQEDMLLTASASAIVSTGVCVNQLRGTGLPIQIDEK
jgi:hypothetical protein